MNLFKKYAKWSRGRIQRHIFYWLSWSLFYVLVNYFSNEGEPLSKWIAFEAVVLPVKVTFTYFVAYFLMPMFLYQNRIGQFAISFVCSLLVFGYLLFWVYSTIVNPQIMGGIPPYKSDQFVYKGLELIYIASIFVGFKFFQNYQNEQQQNQKLIQEKAEAELKYLRNQIQPHFLFNTLNNIYGMVLSDNKKAASNTIVEFSNLLSYMLYDSNVLKVPLEKELQYLESYIELEKLRYSDRLELTYEKTIESKSNQIAPLLLIPLVENAFKHGPAKEKSRSFIEIRIVVNHECLFFKVRNSFKENTAQPDIQSGIGLANVQKRLQLIYPNNHEMTVKKEGTFQVCIKLLTHE